MNEIPSFPTNIQTMYYCIHILHLSIISSLIKGVKIVQIYVRG